MPVEVLNSAEEAAYMMHRYAETLRKLGVAQRFGAYIEKTQPARKHSPWGVFIHDRAEGKPQ